MPEPVEKDRSSYKGSNYRRRYGKDYDYDDDDYDSTLDPTYDDDEYNPRQKSLHRRVKDKVEDVVPSGTSNQEKSNIIRKAKREVKKHDIYTTNGEGANDQQIERAVKKVYRDKRNNLYS